MFPYDWVKNKLNEIEDVFNIISYIEKIDLNEFEKDSIRNDML